MSAGCPRNCNRTPKITGSALLWDILAIHNMLKTDRVMMTEDEKFRKCMEVRKNASSFLLFVSDKFTNHWRQSSRDG